MEEANLFSSVNAWFDKYYNDKSRRYEYPIKNKLLDEIFETYHSQSPGSPYWKSTLSRIIMLQNQYDVEAAIESLESDNSRISIDINKGPRNFLEIFRKRLEAAKLNLRS